MQQRSLLLPIDSMVTSQSAVDSHTCPLTTAALLHDAARWWGLSGLAQVNQRLQTFRT